MGGRVERAAAERGFGGRVDLVREGPAPGMEGLDGSAVVPLQRDLVQTATPKLMPRSLG